MNLSDQHSVLHESAGFFRRTRRGRLLLTGADRLSYLHGLLTNDIQGLAPGSGCYAALLTPQGRMITDMRLFELGDSVLLDLDRTLAPAVHAHLDRFVITENVVVEDVSDRLDQVGVYGPRAAEVIGRVLRAKGEPGEPSPDRFVLDALATYGSQRWDFSGAPLHLLRSDDIGVAGFDLILPTERAPALEAALAREGAVAVGEEAVEIARIEAGIPRFLVDMDATTIPLEAGIEERAISMTKGCYVGQEVIVRVLHRGGGRVAKKLVALRADDRIAEDDRLYSGDREVGRITSAAESPRSGWVGLGYVQRDHAVEGTEAQVRRGDHLVRCRVVERRA